MNDRINCPICFSPKIEKLYLVSTNYSMFSDSRIIKTKGFVKYYCHKCQFGFADSTFIKNNFYTDDYILNIGLDEEHYFLINEKTIARSYLIYETFFKKEFEKSAGNFSLLEIGCGKGSLLNIIKDNFNLSRVIGIEPSKKSADIGKKNGLNINNIDINNFVKFNKKKFDFVISFGVLEHVENPHQFVFQAKSLLKENGTFMAGLPNSSVFSYDIFFRDHLSHFTPKNLIFLLRENNIIPMELITGNLILNNFQCIIGKKSDDSYDLKFEEIYLTSKVKESFFYFNKIFQNINKKILEYNSIILYGSGEVLSLLFAYTDLNASDKIRFIIDDNPNKKYFNTISIFKSCQKNLRNIDGLLIVTTNKIYYNTIKEKIIKKGFRGDIMFPFESLKMKG